MTPNAAAGFAAPKPAAIDSGYAWARLGVALLLSTIGGVGMWSVVVVLPALQKDLGISRSEASLAYTLTMIGFGLGGVVMGRLTDRFGLFRPLVAGSIVLCLGYLASSHATNIWQFALAQGVFIAFFGSSSTFGPLMADTSLWFERRRGIAVAICASGNYLAGTFWPPIVQKLIEGYGWRQTHIFIGLFCVATMVPLAFAVRRRPPLHQPVASGASAAIAQSRRIRLSPNLMQGLLMFAGVACCVAMSMPQVHIVAYCIDLSYEAARGAEMLSIMMAFGIISRLASGVVADRIGGLRTLLAGSFLQMVALWLYIPFNGLTSLYVVSALFGLFQGGLVPSYAIVVRENFPPHETGMRVGMTMTATLVGMAFGGWLSGVVFDYTGSYRMAFLNGILWNSFNLAIVIFLLFRTERPKSSGSSSAAAPAAVAA